MCPGWALTHRISGSLFTWGHCWQDISLAAVVVERDARKPA